MATVFSEMLEGTDGATIIHVGGSGTPNVNFNNKTGTWLFETSQKAEGNSCGQVSIVAPNTAALSYIYPAAVTTMYHDYCFRFPPGAFPAAEQMILQLTNGGTVKAEVRISAAGVLRIRNGTSQVDIATVVVINPGEWFRLKWGITGTTQELRIYTAAGPAQLFGTNPTETLTGNYTQGAWDRIKSGLLVSVDSTIQMDRVIMDDSTWPVSGGEGNQTPTANAGPNQDSVIGGDTVTLNGTASSDPDGSIAQYAWTQSGGTTVNLSNPAVAQPTFVAPNTAGTATFQLRVTDNDGAESAPDSVTITWSDAPANLPTSDFYELFETGAVGNALTASPGNTDFDSLDTGWTFDSTVIGNGQSAKVTGNGSVRILTHILPAGLVSSRYVDAIFQISDLSVGPWYIMRAMSGSSVRGTVRIDADGGVRIRAGADGATAVGSATTTKVVAGQPFRIAWHINNGGTTEARLFLGADLFNAPANYTAFTSGSMSSGTFDRVGFGIAQPAVASGTIYVDTTQVEATTWAEPFGGQPAALSELYQMDGTTPGVWQPISINVIT